MSRRPDRKDSFRKTWHIFSGDAPGQRPVTDEIREAAERFAAPGYRALASRLG